MGDNQNAAVLTDRAGDVEKWRLVQERSAGTIAGADQPGARRQPDGSQVEPGGRQARGAGGNTAGYEGSATEEMQGKGKAGGPKATRGQAAEGVGKWVAQGWERNKDTGNTECAGEKCRKEAVD